MGAEADDAFVLWFGFNVKAARRNQLGPTHIINFPALLPQTHQEPRYRPVVYALAC